MQGDLTPLTSLLGLRSLTLQTQRQHTVTFLTALTRLTQLLLSLPAYLEGVVVPALPTLRNFWLHNHYTLQDDDPLPLLLASSLTSLRFTECGPTDLENVAARCPLLQRLSFSIYGGRTLLPALAQLTCLTQLTMESCMLKGEEDAAFVDSDDEEAGWLCGLPTLRELRLTPGTQVSGNHVAHALQANPHLRILPYGTTPDPRDEDNARLHPWRTLAYLQAEEANQELV